MSEPKMVYKVPVVWSMMGYVLVDAHSGEEAMQYTKEHINELSLPCNAEYLDDSFEVDEGGEPILIGAYYGKLDEGE